ncbi:DUF805 domain-containing protein [Leifsonia aquatica]|uniref:DUF805 domain-containing protein n=1 Tax=Leifsonia aquatica TaxID=144185 RepID=UPI00384A6F3B
MNYFEPATPQNAARPEFPSAPRPGGAYDGAWTPDDLDRPLYGATFGQAIKRFFRNYRRFSGRASRSEYWWTQLFFLAVEAVAFIPIVISTIILAPSDGAVDASTAAVSGAFALYLAGGLLLVAFFVACAIPYLAIHWRRLHDANLSGALFLLTLIPYVSIVVVIFTLQSPKPAGRRFDRIRLIAPDSRLPR